MFKIKSRKLTKKKAFESGDSRELEENNNVVVLDRFGKPIGETVQLTKWDDGQEDSINHAATEQQEPAEPVEPVPIDSVFDYDGEYDSIKQAERRAKLQREGVQDSRQARYIGGMMKQSFERSKEKMRYEERRLQRELEDEMAQNPDLDPSKMETFVTESYLEHQKQLREIEEEERRKEKEEMEKGSGNYANFYRNILDMQASTRFNAYSSQVQSKDEFRVDRPVHSTDEESIAARESVKRDADGEEILAAGLNVLKKPTKPVLSNNARAPASPAGRFFRGQEQLHRRDKISAQFEDQLREFEAEEAENARKKEEEARQKLSRKTTNDSVQSAKERALQRRKERLAKQKSETGND